MLTSPVASLLILVLYEGMLLLLFRARRDIGTGVMVAAIASLPFVSAAMHGIDHPITAPVIATWPFIVHIQFMSLVLLLYLTKGEGVARQPIYGLIASIVPLLLCAGVAGATRLPLERSAEWVGLGRAAALLLWSAMLVLLETVLVFPLLDRLRTRMRGSLAAPLVLTLAADGTFHHLLTYPALHLIFQTQPVHAVSTWLLIMCASLFFGTTLAFWLKQVEGFQADTPASG